MENLTFRDFRDYCGIIQNVEPKVIFEDKDLLVLDKPAGMIVNRSDTTAGEKTVQEWVEEYLKVSKEEEVSKVSNGEDKTPFDTFDTFVSPSDTFKARAGIVHRLDKETSGILLVAKTPQAFVNLQAQFKERKVQKTYIALAHGRIEPIEGEIDVSVGRLPWNRKRFGVISEGRGSITKYKLIKNYKLKNKNSEEELSLVELYPKTGRTHQIRVHLQYIHHPIFADPLYAGRKTSRNDRKLLSRIFLHASKISFYHPRTNELITFESLLHYELDKFLHSLNVNKA